MSRSSRTILGHLAHRSLIALSFAASAAQAASTSPATTASTALVASPSPGVATATASSIPVGPPTVSRERLPAELASLTEEEVARIVRMSPLPSLPPDPTNRVADDPVAARLGHRLFFDTRLSPAGISCAACHDPARHFTDGRALARGIGESTRNAPTVVDAARRRWTGWDGKFDSLWSQALSPIENPLEMGSTRERVVAVVREDDELRRLYEACFGPMPSATTLAEPEARDIATANILKALGAYQRRLLSEPAPIDRLVASLAAPATGADAAAERVGEEALTPEALRGLALFVSKAGCHQCHRGASFTDEEFHNLGLPGANRRVADDPARLAAVDFLQANPWNAAGTWSDAPASPKAAVVRGLRRSGDLFGQFRTPSLRGVALTAPYMHDGRFASLEEVVRFYDTLEGASPVGHHGEMVLEPLGLGERGRADLVAFLRALGETSPDSEWAMHPSDAAPRTAGHAP
jgi:cytochrome c peroxidase